jgi:hypothetical protein
VSARTPRTPSYRLHKPSGQAVVTLNGRDVYLGKHGTPESRAEYDRLIAEWLLNGRRPAPTGAGADLTGNELLLAYLTMGRWLLRQSRRADLLMYSLRYIWRISRGLVSGSSSS